MEQKITRLSELIKATEENLKNFGYTEYSLERFRSGWRKLEKFLAERGNPLYTPVVGLEFLRKEVGYPAYIPYLESQKYSLIVRGVRLLNNYQENRSIAPRIPLSKTNWPPDLESLRKAYTNYCNEHEYSKSTVRGFLQAADPFLRDVVMHKGIALQDITPQDISHHVTTLGEFTIRTIDTWTRGLRHFMKFLFESGYTISDLSKCVPRTKAAKPERLPSTLTVEEIQRLLGVIDRGNPVGKRDFAAIIIAVLLGLRDSDITALNLDNFNWDKRRIELVQQKTGEPLYLPLMQPILEALVDYFKNGRPVTKCQNIFVRHCAPYGKLVSFYSPMAKYMSKAGIKTANSPMRGLHILRHTLASGLIMQGEAYETVSAALGHINAGSTDTYAHIDVDGLLQCALDPEEVGFFEDKTTV